MFRQKVPHLGRQSRTKASKQFILLFLALLQICGFVTLVVSIWTVVYHQIDNCSIFQIVDGNLLLASSLLGILLCWSGFCVILKDKEEQFELNPLLCVFFVVITLQISAGIFATVNSSREDEFLSKIEAIFHSNNTLSMICSRNIQTKFGCCGYNNYSDWLSHTESIIMLTSCECSHGNSDCQSINFNGATYSLHKHTCQYTLLNESLKKQIVIRVFSALIPVVEVALLIFTSCMLNRLSRKSVIEADNTVCEKVNAYTSYSSVQLHTYI